jgi:hypothetical protein
VVDGHSLPDRSPSVSEGPGQKGNHRMHRNPDGDWRWSASRIVNMWLLPRVKGLPATPPLSTAGSANDEMRFNGTYVGQPTMVDVFRGPTRSH